MYKQEQKQIKRNLQNFIQPNQQINYENILKNKANYNSVAPTYTNERSKNLQKVFYKFNYFRKKKFWICVS